MVEKLEEARNARLGRRECGNSRGRVQVEFVVRISAIQELLAESALSARYVIRMQELLADKNNPHI